MASIKVDINPHDGNLRLAISAAGFEQEVFFIPQDDVNRLLNRCRLIESYLYHPRPGGFAGDFANIGLEISRLFLLPFSRFQDVIQNARSQNLPVLIDICSQDPLIGKVPWELAFVEGRGFLTVSPRFRMVRTIPDGSPEAELSAGPLRILFMACSPEGGGALLDYEREEEIILNAVAELRQKKQLEIDIAEGGTLEELTRLLSEKEYHVVHLSGHGIYDEDENTGCLIMEKPSGMADEVGAETFADALIGFKSVRLLFLASCESAKEHAPNTGLARLLAARGVPMVIAMKHAVGDVAITKMASDFYYQLTLKRPVAPALQLARNAYAEKQVKSFQWMIPALFSKTGDTDLIDWKKPLSEIQTQTKPPVLYGKVRHLKTGFRGRRREIREFLGMLRDGNPPAVCITGAGGIGKSTLAARITDRLYHSGFRVIPLFGELTPDKIVRETIRVLISEKAKDDIEFLKGLSDSNEKIGYVLSNVMGTKETLLLLNNFEDNLKASAGFREFKNTFFEHTFHMMLEQLPHTPSRILITCRYAVPLPDAELLKEIPLKELSRREARKLMVFKPEFAGIFQKQMPEIHETIGGNPKAIEELGNLLKIGKMPWQNLKEKLESVSETMREFTLFETLYNLLGDSEKRLFRFCVDCECSIMCPVMLSPSPFQMLQIEHLKNHPNQCV